MNASNGSYPTSAAIAATLRPRIAGSGAVTSTIRSQPTPSTEDWNPDSPSSTAARRRSRFPRAITAMSAAGAHGGSNEDSEEFHASYGYWSPEASGRIVHAREQLLRRGPTFPPTRT